MGNCVGKPLKQEPRSAMISHPLGNNQILFFHATLSKVKIRELPSSILKNSLISVSFKFPNEFYQCPEMLATNEIVRWENSHSFFYSASLSEVNFQKLEIAVSCGKKTICSTEIKLKSIIDGPLHQNTCLIANGLVKGRLSFDLEFLEETTLSVLADRISCNLDENNIGNFSVSLKFMSETIQESLHSPISEDPDWDFSLTDKPSLELQVTMKGIRDAALQIRLYKHHKMEFELAAECWVSFTKLFAQDMETIYRKQSFLEYKTNSSAGHVNFEKAAKAITREHYKTLNEELWLCGRKVGFVSGMIKITGMPTFVQLISGVNTENGITVQNINIVERTKGKNKKSKVPKEILTIEKLTSRLKESIQSTSSSVGPAHERKLFKTKKEIIDSICAELSISNKETLIIYTYSSPKSLLKSQKILINLCNHLIEYAPLVTYDIKPYYFKCITLGLSRGELDIGYLSLIKSAEELIEEKKKVALEYCKMLNEALRLSLSRMALKGIDDMTQDYVDKSLAICWFRVPEFRDIFKGLVKKKSYYTIYEWRNIESGLDHDVDLGISNPLDWGPFYELIPKDFASPSCAAELKKKSWRSKIEKRGIAFFSFFENWLEHAHKQTVSQHFIWSNLPGYKSLLSSFLIELKERNIIEYPEALINCACKMLYNPKLLNIIVRIVFSKTNIYDFNTVQETFKFLDILFTAYFMLSKKLPSTFDHSFFTLGIKICLEDENALNIARCLQFIYNQYHLFKGNLRKDIILKLFAQKNFKKYFFHWSKDIRNATHHIVLFRIRSRKILNFEQPSSITETDIQISALIKEKIQGASPSTLRSLQSPYYKVALEEYLVLKKEYKEWEKKLPTQTGKAYTVSEDFPYPRIKIKLNYLDLAERKLEEQW